MYKGKFNFIEESEINGFLFPFEQVIKENCVLFPLKLFLRAVTKEIFLFSIKGIRERDIEAVIEWCALAETPRVVRIKIPRARRVENNFECKRACVKLCEYSRLAKKNCRLYYNRIRFSSSFFFDFLERN